MVIAFAFLIGVITGLRALMGLTMVSWGAGLGWIPLGDTPLHWLGLPITRYILSFLALGELVNDKLPKTPSRKVPPQFIIRIVMGGFSGAAIGLAKGSWIVGLIAGAVGAVVGTLGGAEFRGRLAKAIGKDLPIALLEDAIAIIGGFLIVSHLQ
ncbi:putative membrane protein [Silvibacterium bohemicum]|uniref:Putative membrane protein n=1 Tax=Silvibacterium bohemicum TaxID=1577686 RepID=A0A841JY93_9BACT|nr:DUF4126 family protein [Silvibacterium bohemicum]MBB6143408.1 putative membrane protein [Silvibacterium bohemicum]